MKGCIIFILLFLIPFKSFSLSMKSDEMDELVPLLPFILLGNALKPEDAVHYKDPNIIKNYHEEVLTSRELGGPVGVRISLDIDPSGNPDLEQHVKSFMSQAVLFYDNSTSTAGYEIEVHIRQSPNGKGTVSHLFFDVLYGRCQPCEEETPLPGNRYSIKQTYAFDNHKGILDKDGPVESQPHLAIQNPKRLNFVLKGQKRIYLSEALIETMKANDSILFKEQIWKKMEESYSLENIKSRDWEICETEQKHNYDGNAYCAPKHKVKDWHYYDTKYL